MIRSLIFMTTLSLISIALLAQDGSSCATPLLVTCNKYMHIDHLFEGTLTDNGAMPCVDDFQEVAGIWLELKIGRSGQLAFDLVPDDPDQDLDFTLFKGNDCGALEAVRCVGGGRSADGHSGCMGATGLRAGEVDYFEMMGCPKGQNNYGAALEVNQNERLFLYVHGFKSENHGFGITFGNVLLGVANSISEAVSVHWADDSDLILEYTNPITNHSDVVWNVQCGSNQQVLFGRGPHIQNAEDTSNVLWSLTSVVKEECIVEIGGNFMAIENAEDAKIWPSPTTGLMQIQINDNGVAKAVNRIDFFSSIGSLELSIQKLSDEQTIIDADISMLPSGVYWIVMEGGRCLGKVVKK
ncbi:MAG: T9SS type A sorting domain-containing protein [Lewinellaceae bacterium]|nr:T9SS type A sorting domain-containing protein [Lewinellaceae bacterium]